MRPTLSNLQALRGLACLAVVLYHVAGWELLVWPRFYLLWPVRWFGFAGVDLFFVLSGFIITHAHWRYLGTRQGLGTYLWRRAWRIYPPYWAALLLAALVALIFTGENAFTREYLHTSWDMGVLLPRAEGYALLPVAWSLVYELMFYAAFTLALVVPRRVTLLLAMLWALAVLALGTRITQPHACTFTLSPFVLEFLGGAAIARCVALGWHRHARTCLGGAVAWGLLGGGIFHHSNPDILAGDLPRRVLVFGPVAVLVVYAAVAGEHTGTIRLWRWLRPLGDASYSIYLLHLPMGTVALFLTWGISHGLFPHLVWLFAMVGAGVLGGWLFYRGVEKPLHDLGRRPKPRHAVQPEPTVAISARIPMGKPECEQAQSGIVQ